MVIVLMGVSGCGKTTVGRMLADRLGYPFFDGDDFHPSANVEKMSRKEPLTEADRHPWLETLGGMVRKWCDKGDNAILACSALTEGARRTLGTDLAPVTLVHLKGPFDLIRARLLARRDHFMPPDLLRSQYEALEEPKDAITIDISGGADEVCRRILEALRRGTIKSPVRGLPCARSSDPTG